MNLQQTATELARKYGLNTPVMARYVDLVAEVGEIGKELLVGSDYGAKDIEATGDMVKEMGDVVFSLALLASSLDLDLEECLQQNHRKISNAV